MKLPEKLTEPTMEYGIQGTVNQLIDYLAEREALEQMSGVPDAVIGNMPTPLFKAEDIKLAHYAPPLKTWLTIELKDVNKAWEVREALLKLTK